MAHRLEILRKKLAARQGRPGYEKNCEALQAEIARLEHVPPEDIQQLDDQPKRTKKRKRYRSAESGQFVEREVAEENPATTVSETVASKE
jgi:hypothetical protein